MHNTSAWLKERSVAGAARLCAAVSRRGNEMRMRLRKRIVSPRALIARLGTTVACITILAPPALYAWVSSNQLRQHALEQASIGARHIEVQLSRKESIDWLAQASMNVLHATQGAKSSIAASWVTDEAGGTLMFQGQSAWWPELGAKAKINAAVFRGFFHVAVSTRQVFLGTLQTALAFLVLGLAAYYCFQRLPLAALDRALLRLEAKQQELIEQKRQLEMQNLRFDAALNNMSPALCMFDGKHELVVCNTPYAKMYGLPEELTKPGTPFRAVMERRIANGLHVGNSVEEYIRDVIECMADERPITKVAELSDGRAVTIKQRRMPDGGWISTHEDITEIRRIEARVAYLARHDVLTDLPNRLHLRERLDEAAATTRKGENVAVLCLDLDRFKEINDTLGHTLGDDMLKAVGDRLRHCLGERDMIARLSADEFAVLQATGEQPFAATSLAGTIIEAMSLPFDLNGQQITVGVSIGIAVSSGSGSRADELLKNADLALHRAKAEGGSTYRFFETGMDADMQARCKLQFDLRKALSNGEFELYYQPVVNLERNEIAGLEALLRWHHPERGRVSPAVFIPVAEETGLILPIGEWALRQACTDAATWPEHIKVAVNLSPAQFRSPNLVQMVFAALASSGLSAGRLELEITESVLLHDNAATVATLHQLRSLGVRIAMDDFGTGYSSLSYLRSFPFDKIKIDRCFVKDLADDDGGSLAILRAVSNLGLSLGMATTAEGVETQEQVDKVRAEGCTEMQGFFFSPPRPIKEIERLFLQPVERAASAA
jgi:diguanylate cyclase (GGDEF)-like protein